MPAAPLAACSLSALLFLSACDSAPREQRESAARASAVTLSAWPIPARIDAFAGEPTVLPLPADTPPGVPQVRLDDGVELRAAQAFLSVTQAKPDAWLGPIGDWQASPSPTPGALRVLIFTLPPQAKGQGIWINQTRHDVQWLLSPRDIAGDSPAAWQPTLPNFAAGNANALARLRDAARNPLDRWRVRLLLDGMAADVPPTRFDDPTIESFALYIEQRWRVALARVYREDPAACLRFKQRLSALVEFSKTSILPAWPTDRPGLERLVNDLLGAKPGAVTLRVEQFLAEQPQGVVWVADDCAVLAADSQPLPTIGIANLSGKDALARAALGEELPSTELTPIPAYAARLLTVAGGMPQTPDATPKVSVALGKWTAATPVAAKPIPVEPPGLIVGPLLPDLSMQRWLAAQVGAPAADRSLNALVFRPAADAEGRRRWSILIECHTPPGEAPSAADRVSIYFGPPGAPNGYLAIDATGRVSRDPRESVIEGPPIIIHVQRAEDRWTCIIPLPDNAIERKGLLRLGLTRRDCSGARASWPRPLLPWQEFPSRALLNLDAWTGFPEAVKER
ncbi:MAG: hypothetical protein JSR77_03605 [Planctomycetes bacterium]|nr:hypothetical protein [Planctomycetota bacterium]